MVTRATTRINLAWLFDARFMSFRLFRGRVTSLGILFFADFCVPIVRVGA